MKDFVWVFKKRTRLPVDEEKKEYEEIDHEDDDDEYVVIRSTEYWIYENNVEIHNEIVRVLRKIPMQSYMFF